MAKRNLLWALLLSSAAVLPARAQDMAPAGIEDRVIVAFKPGVSEAEQRKVVESFGLKFVDSIPGMRVVLAQAQTGRSSPALVNLAANPKVFKAGRDMWRKWIEEAPATLQGTPLPTLEAVRQALPKLRLRSQEEPAPPAPSAGEAPWGVVRVNAPAAWPSNQGAGIKVAVVDTGIDPEHPDLKERVKGGHNSVEKDKPWADDHFHGTHVAGTIAATLDEKGVAGVAPKVELYAVKVLTKEGSGSLFGIMDGLMWCAQNGMQVANMSLGAPQGNQLFEYAVQMAYNGGVAIIAAAGNDGKDVNYPAAYKETIAVTALCPPGITETKLCPSASEGIATFSSRGPQVAFIAPGVRIPSTVPLVHDPSGIKAYSGTSMATPHVAGLAALAVAKGAQGPEGVRAALKAAATRLPGMSDAEQGNGLIDAAKFK